MNRFLAIVAVDGVGYDGRWVTREDSQRPALANVIPHMHGLLALTATWESNKTETAVIGENARLRILHIILMLGETNGQYNEHCLPLYRERDLAICTYFEPRLTPPPEIALFPGDGSVRGFLSSLRAALTAKSYDVIHVHAPQSGGLLLVALLLWRRFRNLRSSLVYTVQDSFYDYSRRNQALTLLSLIGFGRLIFCSHAAYASLPSIWRRSIKAKSWVVPNGADIARVDRAVGGMKRQTDKSDFTVAWVGRMEVVKDPLAAVEAFSRAAEVNTRMVMIGGGQLESAVVVRVSSLAAGDRVELTGLIPRDEVFIRCAQSDLFMSCSHGEGMPVAVIEAMAAQCPVVLSDIAPHRELIDGADFMPLVAVGDVEGFAEEIRRFQKMSADERLEIGQRCRQHVLARFTLPAMHAGVEAVYRRQSRPSVAHPSVGQSSWR